MTDLDITMPDPELMAILGRRLRALRKAVGLTQIEASEKTGLDRSTISPCGAG